MLNSPMTIFQVRRLLDTLQMRRSARSSGHLLLYSTLLLGHTEYTGKQRISCWPFTTKQLRTSNRQDLVFIRPPGIETGGFTLKIDNVWFCRLLLLFSFVSKNDSGEHLHECAFVSVLEDYKGRHRPGELG